MAVEEKRIVEENEVVGVSPWLLLMRDEIRKLGNAALGSSERDDMTYDVLHNGGSIWIIARWPTGARVAFCAAYAPAGLVTLKEQVWDGSSLDVRLNTIFGEYCVRIDLPTKGRSVLHWKTSLNPNIDLITPFWPRDILPLDLEDNPLGTRGIVHAAQQGPKGALLYAVLTRPATGSFLYMQNLTALNEYLEQTGTTPANVVGGGWPELGFSLPAGSERALKSGKEVVISDAYVLPSSESPDDDLASARVFLTLYAELYLAYPRPSAMHRDWPRRIGETIRDLSHSPECSVDIGDHRYMLAYVGAKDLPPESMVQLAVLVPMVEYSRAYGESIPLIDELKANLPNFFDAEIGTIVRWLPGQERLLAGKEEHMAPTVMDSWYLWHTYHNLSRLAIMGEAEAKRLFLASIEYGIRVAHRFEYRWPIFFDLKALETVKAEATPGQGGECDVGALYAHVMQQAWKLTGDRRYLEEATRAAQQLRGLGFRLGYQFNNTSFGAGALLNLWRETGDDLYLKLSYVCLANIVRNFWLWQCDYGHAKHYTTFMGLPPLQDAVYLAIYEELEVLAAFHEYLQVGGDDILPALRILLPEYCKYLLDRAWYHYPSELPVDVLAEHAKSGHLNRHLSVPLEDLSEGSKHAGEVGQEVYGTAAPFVFATRHAFPIPEAEFVISCNYPIRNFLVEKSAKGGNAKLDVMGDRRCRCQLQITASNYIPLPDIRISLGSRGGRKTLKTKLTEFGHIECDLPGNAKVSVIWTSAAAKGNGSLPAGHRRKATARSDGSKTASNGSTKRSIKDRRDSRG